MTVIGCQLLSDNEQIVKLYTELKHCMKHKIFPYTQRETENTDCYCYYCKFVCLFADCIFDRDVICPNMWWNAIYTKLAVKIDMKLSFR